MAPANRFMFPPDPVLRRLFIAAKNSSGSELIIQDEFGFKKTYPELLGDIQRMRSTLLDQLDSSLVDERGILYEGSRFICILARSGYEFLVAFFAIRAIGGAGMPLDPDSSIKDALDALSKSKTVCILVGRDCLEKGEAIRERTHSHGVTKTLKLILISCNSAPLTISYVGIDDALLIGEDEPGLVMFTSGSTGPRKGVVLPRRCFSCIRLAKPGIVTLSYRPSHWMGGARSLIIPMITGKKLYILAERVGRSGAEAVLEAFKHHGVNDIVFNPGLLQRMKDVICHENEALSEVKKKEWSGYFQGLSTIRCSSATIDQSTIQFWTALTGLPFQNAYASTELGGAATFGIPRVKGSVGRALPGMQVKLSEVDHGEILVKSDSMFKYYMGDEIATKVAFDEEGYFKTGDLAELKDGEYIFLGRENVDYVYVGPFRFSAVAVESSLMDLPYISDACVIAVPKHEAKYSCGAIVQLRQTVMLTGQLTLAQLRSDLQSSLASFMMPTLLRILRNEEELPRTVSGKPMKRQVLRDYFGSVDGLPPKIAKSRIEQCQYPGVVQMVDDSLPDMLA